MSSKSTCASWNIQTFEKLTKNFYKIEKTGEKDFSTELYIHQVNLNFRKNYLEYYHAEKSQEHWLQ